MLKKILILAVIIFCAASQKSFAAFNDIPSGHWAQEKIISLENEGIIRPDAQGNFNGDSKSTRYDLAEMLAGLLNAHYHIEIPEGNPFSDLVQSNRYYNAVLEVTGLEIMSGYGDNTFRGNKIIDRFNLALALDTLLLVTEKYSDAPTKRIYFSDVPKGHWAYEPVNRLAEAGILEGYGDGTFRGNNNVTRYELALIISNINDKFFK